MEELEEWSWYGKWRRAKKWAASTEEIDQEWVKIDRKRERNRGGKGGRMKKIDRYSG